MWVYFPTSIPNKDTHKGCYKAAAVTLMHGLHGGLVSLIVCVVLEVHTNHMISVLSDAECAHD